MADWMDRISELRARARALEERLADPAVAKQPAELAKAGKELSELRPLLDAGRRYEETLRSLAEARALAADADPEMAELARSELPELEARGKALESEIRVLLRPKDPNDEKNAILEIRAGAGGDEAALFAAELFRMYSRYAESQGWKVELLSESATGGGGLKEVIAGVSGKNVYGRLKHERGVHRVQRVPATEGAGRIHTSTVTVAIMPEAEEVDIAINPADLRIDVFRASGPGGQSVNTTDSAVRMTHLPTGIVVSCQNEKSQIQNRAAALRVLQARLLVVRQAEQRAEMDALKGEGSSWGNQMRSYVLHPYQMVKDLRTEVETGNPANVLDGDIDSFIEAGIRWRKQQESVDVA